jgi:hypothetical protein
VFEYRSLILEQLGHEREQAFLDSLTPEERADALDETHVYNPAPRTAAANQQPPAAGAESTETDNSSSVFNIGGYFSSWKSTPTPTPTTPDIAASTNAQAVSTPKHLRPYGVLVYYINIRDLGGLGMEHVSTDGREIISKVVSVASDNYPGTQSCAVV